MDVSVKDRPFAITSQGSDRLGVHLYCHRRLKPCRLEPEVEAACTCIEADELRHRL